MSAPAPKCYRYARFSHSVQAEGGSLERQKVSAEAWAAQRGMTISDAFTDDGVSAAKGKNLELGAFAKFWDAVGAGDVKPGSYLLVESVSRFSRLSPLDAIPILRELVETGGINVVFLDHGGMEVTAESIYTPQVGLILQVLGYMAEEYSANLSRYRKRSWGQAWAAARKNGEAATRTLPYWLRCDVDAEGNRGPIERHPTYAPIVKRIFAEYLSGSGKGQIAAQLNSEGVPPPPRIGTDKGADHWRHGLIGRTLANRAVLGEYQPHEDIKRRTPLRNVSINQKLKVLLARKRKANGAVLPDYYPQVISPETFERAARMRERKAPAPGKVLGSNRVSAVLHLLSRLATCPACGRSMMRKNKGDGRPAYVCSRSLASKECRRVYVPVAAVERALLDAADALKDSTPGADPALADKLSQVLTAHAAADAKLTTLTDRLMTMIENGEEISSAVNVAHTKLEAERDALAAELATLRGKSAATQTNVIKQRVAAMVGALKNYAPGDPLAFDASMVNASLFDCFERVVIDYKTGELVMHWRHGPPPSRVRYQVQA